MVLQKFKSLIGQFWHVIVLVLAVVLLLVQPEQMSVNTAAKRIEQKIADDVTAFEAICNNKSLKDKIYRGAATEEDLVKLKSINLPLFFYEDDSLVFWTENKSLLLSKPSLIKDKVSLQRLQNGWYIAFKQIEAGGTKAIVGLDLVQHTFATPGKFLRNELDMGISLPKRYQFALSAPISSVRSAAVSINQVPAFYLEETNTNAGEDDNGILVALLFVIFFVLAYYVNSVSVKLLERFDFRQIFVSFVLSSIVLVFFFVWGRSLLLDVSPPLFNPVYCASSWFVLSLGDLLLYCLLPVWWLLFAAKFKDFDYPIAKAKWKRHIHQSLLLLAVYTSSLFLVFVVKTLVIDSLVSLQIFNLLSLDLYSFVGLFCIALIVLAHYLVSFRVIKLIYGISLSTVSFLLNCLVFTIVFSVPFLNSEYSEVLIASALWTSAWLLIMLSVYEDQFTLRSTKNLVIITALYALIGTYLIENLYEKRERNLRTLAAQTLLQERDFLTETNFEQTVAAIKKDIAISKETSDEAIRERLNTFYFNKYLNKYDLQMSLADSKSLSNELLQFDALKLRTLGALNPSDLLKLCEDSVGQYAYIGLIEAGARSIAVEMKPRIYASGNLYAELIADNSLANRVNEEGFSYAIYRHNKLVAQRGEYAYSYYWNDEYKFDGAKEVFIDVPGWEHNIHELDNNKRVIVTVKQESFFEPVASFSYLFTYFFLLVAVFLLFIKLRKKILYNEQFFDGFYTSFRTRINYSLLAIIFASFVVIGIITISFFREQYNQFYADRLAAKENAVITALELHLKMHYKGQQAQQNVLQELGQELNQLSLINSIDINLFDLKGNLIATSQAPLFDRGILSRKMNAAAFFHFAGSTESQFSQSENIGALNYRATYFPLNDANENTLAFVGIPYYERNQNIEDEVGAFLIALMNVYVFLLICAAALAYFISNSVTRPLSFIADKLQMVNLGKKNEPIEWNSRDEIGILVKQYNRMIRELENSAEQLARTERESAWREMAKQIAHEIKNPLTPMKLSIQYLQKAINENHPNVNQLAERVAKTLTEQIDNLTAIATSFSSFAKMPKGENEVVELNNMLEGITDLFSAEQEANIHFETTLAQALVFADRSQMLSVFNNLVKNGIQAVGDEKIADIKVFISEEHNMIKVEVRDNGVGIEEENYTKVFAPNFTTKSSGTGLGLAITMQIIEGIGGAIWFETVVGEGTSFFVIIPKHTTEV
jgi:two-component system nitrogen regulation sensor histidine kinase NtrY